MPDTKVPFWRRWGWQKWRRAYIAHTPKDNRRAWVRHPCHVPTSVQSVGPNGRGEWSATVRNISLGGMNLVVDRWFESGTLLKVELQTDLENAPRALWVRVIHVTAQPDGTWSLGCAFTRELSEESLRAFQVEPVRPRLPDKRAWLRMSCNSPARIEVGQGEPEKWSAKVLNISPAGIGLLTTREFPRGALLHLDLPGEGHEVRSLLVQVVHVKIHTNGGWLLGCAFAQKLAPEELERLLGARP